MTYSEECLQLNLLRATQRFKELGFWSIKDFETTAVIDDGANNAVSAFQSAICSGEVVFVRPTAYSYKLDGTMFVDNACELFGHMERSKLKRVGDQPGFVIRHDGAIFDGFSIDGWGMTAQAFDFLFGTSVRASRRCAIRNIRGNGSRGGVSDENAYSNDSTDAQGNFVPGRYIYELELRNIYYLGHRGPCYLLRDARKGFLRFFDTQVGLITAGGGDATAYSIANAEGLQMHRVEGTGTMGYPGTSESQKLLSVKNSSAFYFSDVFMDNSGGEGVDIENVHHVQGTLLQGSLCNKEAVKIHGSSSIVNIGEIRGEGRRALGDSNGTYNAVHIGAGVSNAMFGEIRGHNASKHGLYVAASGYTIGSAQTHNNAQYGYVAETGRGVCNVLQSSGNAAGRYWIPNPQNIIELFQFQADAPNPYQPGSVLRQISGPASI